VGKAFRAPTIYDLYRTYESSGRMIYSNPNLDPETILNYEIGAVQYFLGRRLKTEVTAFHSDIDNLIYSYTDDAGDSRKDNAGEASIKGVEISASAVPIDPLVIWANYTYNDSEITRQDKDPEMVGKRITSMPDKTINVGANYTYNWLTLNLAGQYTGRIYKTKYNTDIPNVYKANSTTWLWETKLVADIPYHPQSVKDLQVSLSVENLFDEEYYAYYIGRERSYFAEIKLGW
jgi:iron complex outermembrane receptor protein